VGRRVEGSFPEYKLGVVVCSLLPQRGYPEPVVEGEGLHILPGEAERRTGPGEVVLVVHPRERRHQDLGMLGTVVAQGNLLVRLAEAYQRQRWRPPSWTRDPSYQSREELIVRLRCV